MLYGVLLFIHIVVSIGLITSVLMQASKGGGLAGAFGGSGMAGGVFGGRGAAPFLVKATAAFAIIFMLTSLSLNYVRPGNTSNSVFERVGGTTNTQSAPAVTSEMPVSPVTAPASGTTPAQGASQTQNATPAASGAAVPGATNANGSNSGSGQ